MKQSTTCNKLKSKIADYILQEPEFNYLPLNGILKPYSVKREELVNIVIQTINNMDIRAVVSFIEDNPQVKWPIWIRLKQYYIDYNSNGDLDFIKRVS